MNKNAFEKVVETVFFLFVGVSFYSTLQVLFQTSYWPFIDPFSTGLKMWPIILMTVVLVVPGILISFIRCIVSKEIKVNYLVRLLVPLISPFLLLMTSLPSFDSNATARFIISSVAVFLIPFVVLFCWPKLHADSAGDFVICVFFTMSVRMTSNSINVFYENWIASLVLFIASTLACAVCCTTHKVPEDVGTDVEEPENEDQNSCLTLFSGLMIAMGLTSALMISLQFLSSPGVFVRWSGFTNTPDNLSYLVWVLFFVAVLTCSLGYDLPRCSSEQKGNSPLKKKIAGSLLLVGSIVGILFVAYLLLIFSTGFSALVGSCIYCVFLPFIFTKLFKYLVLYKKIKKHYHSGIVLSFGGILVLVLFTAVVSFTQPALTNVFLGRMDTILGIQVGFICIAVIFGEVLQGKTNSANTDKNQSKKYKAQTVTRFVFVLVTFLVCLVIERTTTTTLLPCTKLDDKLKPVSIQGDSSINVMTYNVLMGQDMNGKGSSRCVARILDNYKPNIVAFQESDPINLNNGNKDYLVSIKSILPNYNIQEGVDIKKGVMGVNLLSDLKVHSHTAGLLPTKNLTSSAFPNYSYTKTVYDIKKWNRKLLVISAHVIYKDYIDPPANSTAAEQIQFLIELSKDVKFPDDPIIILGDLNLNPDEKELFPLWDEGNFKSALNPDRKFHNESTGLYGFVNIDHIFYKNLHLVTPINILSEVGNIADHLPVMAEFEPIN